MNRFHRILSLGTVSALASFAGVSAADQAVDYPAGYRDWTHVKSMVIQEGHALYEAFGGIHHIYANEQAMQGYQAGVFPEGAVIVFDLLEAEQDDQAITEGARKVLGVMVKDSARFESTGGWGFEGFAAGEASQPVVGENADTACYQCHTSQQDRDYVFSSWRE